MANTTQEFNFPINSPFEEEVSWNTLTTKYEDGKEQRRKKWSQPKRTYTISLRGKSKSVSTQVWDFYQSRSGDLDTFYFTNPNETPVENEGFGTGNGSVTAFTLANSPIPSGSLSITVAGTPQTEVTHYTINRSTGVVTFVSAPASGSAINAVSYNFSRTVRFADGKMSRELFNYQLYNFGVKLLQVFV